MLLSDHSYANEFWGKASPEQGVIIQFHPLIAHALDVAAVAGALQSRPPVDIDPSTLCFLVSLHDIGKFSRSFQAKAPIAWPEAALGTFPHRLPPDQPHDLVGLRLLDATFAARLDQVLPSELGWDQSDRRQLWLALAGHHGRPPDPGRADQIDANIVCGACADAAEAFIGAMLAVFQPRHWPRPETDLDVARFAWWLAGLTTLADWIGSRQAWFPYVPAAAVADPLAYYRDIAVPRAGKALAAAGMTATQAAPFGGIQRLFGITTPTPVQRWAETAPLPTGPSLTVIEDLTGSGKTEAALTLAHRLMADGRVDGVYFALPTMATANAMFGRMADSYRALFVSDANPSLALAHGRAILDERFAKTIDGGGARLTQTADPADEPAESHCAAWLAEDRRRTLLAQVGVGTLDQALLAILPVRHATLRLFGIAGKVLIVDEVHAFDAYMRRELAALLRFHAALGGSAILLSATLPQRLRRELVGAFRSGLGVRKPGNILAKMCYPLATIAHGGGAEETYCAPRKNLPRRVAVTRLVDPDSALRRIVAAAGAGAAVVWVRNTVDDAIWAANALRQQNIAPLLFHARFAMADRLEIERNVLHRFGKASTGATRGGVLVATQVVEQSLDIDFDLMVTDLAPVDLLIQRAGRLWRHARGNRPVPGPELLVVAPEPVDDPAKDWIMAALPGTGSVYRDHALLWRSAREVFRRGAITTPDDMRPMIEAAFDREAEGAVPIGLRMSSDDAYAKEMSQTSIGGQNVLDLAKGYDINAGAWDPDTRTPTRLEDRPQVTLRLALLKDGAILPYAQDDDPRRAWALSEVSVAQYRIASCPLPVEMETAAAVAKAGWGKWERESEYVQLALLDAAGDGYRVVSLSKSGQNIMARYDERRGLWW